MDHIIIKYIARMNTHLHVSEQDPAAAATCCEYGNGAIFGTVTFSSRVLIHTLLYMEIKPALNSMKRRQTVTEKQALSRIFENKKKVAQYWEMDGKHLYSSPNVVRVIRQDKQHVYEERKSINMLDRNIYGNITSNSVGQIHMAQDKVQWQAFIYHTVPNKP